MRLAILLTASTLLAGTLMGSTNSDSQFDTARHLYYQGTYGNKDDAKKAEQLFSTLYKKSPNDPRIKAYYGSERLLEAAHTWALWKKYSLSKEGIQLMDAAVAAASDNLEVRFVRAVTTYNLPSFFNRKQQAIQDFDYLSTRVARAAQEGALDKSIAASALLFYGRICKEQSNPTKAEEAWKTAANIAPNSKAGRDSAAELAKLKA